MKINIEAFPDNGSSTLKPFVLKKVEKLSKFYDRIVDADVYLKNNGDPKQGCTVEMRFNVPGERLFCDEKGSSFEEATDKACSAMERLLKKFKAKIADSPLQH